jgi:hypothetical protein
MVTFHGRCKTYLSVIWKRLAQPPPLRVNPLKHHRLLAPTVRYGMVEWSMDSDLIFTVMRVFLGLFAICRFVSPISKLLLCVCEMAVMEQ